MDDMTLITAPQVAESCYTELKEALTRAGMKLNEDKCTAWTTDGRPHNPEGPNSLGGRTRPQRLRGLWIPGHMRRPSG